VKIRFLKDFDARTPDGARRITAGTVLDLDPERAGKLIAAGIAAPELPDPEDLPPGGLKWRTAGGRLVFLVLTHAERERLQRPGEAWFCLEELAIMRGYPPKAVDLMIDAKEIFGAPLMAGEDLPEPAQPKTSGFLGDRQPYRPTAPPEPKNRPP
jgi:hypothetical protein